MIMSLRESDRGILQSGCCKSKRVFVFLLHDTAMQDCYLLLASCCLQKYQVLQNQVFKTGLKYEPDA